MPNAAYTGLGQSIGTGIGSFFDSDEARDKGVLAGLKQQQLQGTIGLSQAHIAALNAKALQDQQETAAAGPDATRQRVMSALGIPLDAAPQIQELQQTGHIAAYDPLPANVPGPVQQAPAWLTPDLATKVGQLFAGQQSVIAKASPNLTDALSAASASDKARVISDTLLGKNDPKAIAPRFAAIDGKPIYSQNAEGSILDQYGGTADQTSPLAQGVIGLRNQQAAQAKAGAAENYAQGRAADAAAGAHSAQAGLTNAKLGLLKSSGADPDDPNALSKDDMSFMAKQYLRGDQSVMTNLGRGAQGAQNIVRMRKAIREEAEKAGLGPEQVALAIAQFQGDKAGFRTAGVKGANIEMAVAEAGQLSDLALEASRKVNRTKFTPVNKAILAAESNTGDPDVASFGAANLAFINTYARAISPSGVPTVSDKQHAIDILNTAQSQGQYEAVINQMKREMSAAQKSPGTVRANMGARMTGKEAPEGAPGVPAASAVEAEMRRRGLIK